MKKIYTKSVFEFNKDTQEFELNKSESQFTFINDSDPIIYFGGGGQSGGGGESTTIQKSEPWDVQKKYLGSGFSAVKSNFMDAPPAQFYPNSTVVPFAPQTEAALQLQTQRALTGSPIQRAGTQQLTDTLAGNYLTSLPDIVYNNPYQQAINENLVMPTINGDYLYGGQGFNAAVDAATRRILPQIESSFERSGRTNSGLAQQAKTQAIADAFAGQYGQERQNQFNAGQMGQSLNELYLSNLGRERDNQIRSMLFAPQMADMDYNDITRLAEVGAQREGLSQEELADRISRWDYEQNAVRNQLANYMALIQGNYGGTTSTTSSMPDSGGGGGYSLSKGLLGAVGGGLGGYAFGTGSSAVPAGIAMGLLGGL